MKTPFSVSLIRIIKDFTLEEIFIPKNVEDIFVSNMEVNRPGLELGGFYEYFDPDRVQILGKTEHSFLENYPPQEAKEHIFTFFSKRPKAVILARGLEPTKGMVEAARKYDVPLLRTGDSTSGFMAALISFLNVQLAPRITRHGVLVEVYGEGLLILGDSGVGKSETAIELVKRGHRLIADDAVELRKVSSKSIVGSAPENIRHFIELRGIGIVNVARIFGMGAIKMTSKIDLIVQLEPWDSNKMYDRMGLERQTTNILGLDITSVTIPVQPGRNLAVVIEVAAMNNRQKKIGYNAAEELLQKLGMESEVIAEDKDESDFDIYK